MQRSADAEAAGALPQVTVGGAPGTAGVDAHGARAHCCESGGGATGRQVGHRAVQASSKGTSISLGVKAPRAQARPGHILLGDRSGRLAKARFGLEVELLGLSDRLGLGYVGTEGGAEVRHVFGFELGHGPGAQARGREGREKVG